MISIRQILDSSRSGAHLRSLNSDAWRQFSRRIREERGGACQICRRCDVQTQVHHLVYEPHKPLEQSDPANVVLLCEHCHAAVHAELIQFRRFVFGRLEVKAFHVLNGALAVGLRRPEYSPLEMAYAIAELVSSPATVNRFVEAWIEKPSAGEDKQP